MTTNKPKVVITLRGGDQLILLSDYQRLQADHERLQAEYKRLQAAHEEELFRVRQDRDTHFGEMMRAVGQVDALQTECEELRHALFESRTNDQQAMAYLNQVRELVGGDDFQDMVRRCETLHKAIRRLCNIYVVDDYYSGDLREEQLNRAVERAIDAAMQGDQPC